MKPIIKEDILNVLKSAITVISKGDYTELTKLSNHTIHDASIFQEDDPVTLAILIYAISKIISRCLEKGKSCPNITPGLQKAVDSLSADDDNAYRASIKNLLSEVSGYDAQMRIYIQEVLDRARIKKAGKLHEHGISIARTAELLGISQWELQSYIGKVYLDTSTDGFRIEDRLRVARELFK